MLNTTNISVPATPDGVTLESSGGYLQVKDAGITAAKLAKVVYVSASSLNTSLTNSYADIAITENIDTHDAYDGTTFTVPAGYAGIYEILVEAMPTAVAAGHSLYTTLDIDGAAIETQSTTDVAPHAILRGVSLNAGQTVNISAKVTTTGEDGKYYLTIKRIGGV